jgi:aminoglycoside phosphotransferase (APT) family kinase protein
MSDGSTTVSQWLNDNLDGTVVHIERQPRWRPVWFATMEASGSTHDYVVRGDRTDMELIFPLDHEMRFQQVMDDHGLPVAPVRGYIEAPCEGVSAAYVMDTVAGEPYLVDAPEPERLSVMTQYMAALAQLHQLPLEPFLAANIVRADTPAESGTVGLARYEERYRRAKLFPDPLLEFGLAWLRRNPPNSQGREAPIAWDSGQFHHANGELVAILDLELAHIGDPMMDLAAFRMRETIGGFGSCAELYRIYEEHRGEPVDLDAIKAHHFAFTLSNRLAFSSALRAPQPESDLMTNLQWCRETDLFATEALAEIMGLDLPTVDVPDPRPTRARPAQEQLENVLRKVMFADDLNEFEAYEIRKAFRLARHIQRSDEIADACDQADLDDLEVLLGHRPENWEAGDAELEAFVLADDGTHDAALVELFHKRGLRAHSLLGPAGSAMTTHHAIQTFD